MKLRFALLSAVATVALAASAQAVSFTETFDGATVGNNIGQVSGWFGTVGGGWATVNTSGVAGSQGLSNGDQGFNWTAHPFDWTAMSVGDMVTIGMDYQASSASIFDDDRMGWTINAGNTTSSNHFGVQLEGTAIQAYWGSLAGNIRTTILSLPAITGGQWYRARNTITKLGGTAAKIDVSFQALDASGLPTGSLYTGSVADTSALGTSSPNASYYAATLVPMFKSFSPTSGSVDNAYFEASVPEPTMLSLLGLAALPLMRRRRA